MVASSTYRGRASPRVGFHRGDHIFLSAIRRANGIPSFPVGMAVYVFLDLLSTTFVCLSVCLSISPSVRRFPILFYTDGRRANILLANSQCFSYVSDAASLFHLIGNQLINELKKKKKEHPCLLENPLRSLDRYPVRVSL